ncbi:unnamed protein product [Heligmosomoides polygyrus]|uniref:Transposase n=1 Tax=Heligmosomoides polygyrus TaxID=6339 RepID=A0A183FRM2_HELPZ|nr:unnamed protein product [Heligmosomoides polygyrus]
MQSDRDLIGCWEIIDTQMLFELLKHFTCFDDALWMLTEGNCVIDDEERPQWSHSNTKSGLLREAIIQCCGQMLAPVINRKPPSGKHVSRKIELNLELAGRYA